MFDLTLTTDAFRQLPAVLEALKAPRLPRSVINYICGCDTANPEVRDSLNLDHNVSPLMSIWFMSGTALDDICQPFAAVVRELKADPPRFIGQDRDSVEGKVAKVLLADLGRWQEVI